MSSAPNDPTPMIEWGSILQYINRTEEAAQHYHRAGVLLHNTQLHSTSIPVLQHALSILSSPSSPSTQDLICSMHMWLGAGFLETNRLESAVEHLRYIADVNTFLSPPPSRPASSATSSAVSEFGTCESLRPQARRSLPGLFVLQAQHGVTLDARARFELAILLAEQGLLERALLQYYEAAVILVNEGNVVNALRVLTYGLENSTEAKLLPAYENLAAFRDNLVAHTNANQQSQQHMQHDNNAWRAM